ncbi:hypothetical protein ACTXGK_07605 [Psychrobacter sp. T6-5]|uniref:hypothetical protein n=1 Tax=Psychrobacter sp. T6-5 TaxID=3457451 RepID=UPI003FD3D4F0
MIYANSLMSSYLTSNKGIILESDLDKRLEDVLKQGFLAVDDCIFLAETFPTNYNKDSLNKKEIEEDFLDFSGFEASTNKFHIEDFTDKDPFVQSIIFLNKFKKKWYGNFPLEGLTVLVSFQDDDIGKFSTFTFHKNRKNEVVYDPKRIDLNSEPIYLEVIS